MYYKTKQVAVRCRKQLVKSNKNSDLVFAGDVFMKKADQARKSEYCNQSPSNRSYIKAVGYLNVAIDIYNMRTEQTQSEEFH